MTVEAASQARPRYAEYRESGVAWVGEVPVHWQVLPLSRRFTIVNGGTPASGEESYWDGDIIWLTPVDVGKANGGRITAGERTISEEGLKNSSARVVPAGSLLLSTRAPIGHVAVAGVPASTNQGCRSLVPIADTDSTFYCYSLIASRSLLQATGKGSTFMELTPTDLGAHPLPVPPPEEQRAIAAFLDGETARVDTLIEKKRLLIERLEEQRTALISRTVARGLPPEAARAAGLDPSPRLKPSGVEWLGDVPEHWEVVRIGRKIQLHRGVDITKEEQHDGRVPVVSSGGVSSFHDVALAPGPGVLVGRKGTAGAVHYIEPDFWPHDTTLWVKDFRGNHPRFVYYKLMSMDLVSFDTGATNPTVNRNLVHPVVVSWPPFAEQCVIAAHLDREGERAGVVRAAVERARERLEEYRTALITAAVTGKIDVRGSAREALAAK